MRILAATAALLLLLPVPAKNQITQTFVDDVITFSRHWGAFLSHLGGCKTLNDPPENCKAQFSYLDYKEFEKSRNAAKRVFKLVDAK